MRLLNHHERPREVAEQNIDEHLQCTSACFNTDTNCSTENFFFMAKSSALFRVGFAEILTFQMVQF
jgi:hypothetical protein